MDISKLIKSIKSTLSCRADVARAVVLSFVSSMPDGKVKGFFSMKAIMSLLLGIVMFTALVPTMAEQFTNAQNNTSGAAATLLGLGMLIVVIIFFAKMIASNGD